MNLKEKVLLDVGFVNRLTDLSDDLPITNREREILTLLACGKTNREISRELMLSHSTVRNHISSIFAKLKISNRSQATAVAIYAGLLNQKLNNEKEIKNANILTCE